MNVERVCKNIIKSGIYICLFLPLFVGKGFLLFPFIFSKVIIFQIIVEVAFLCWLFLILAKKESLSFSPISISILAFFLILFIASVFGVNLQKSIFSTQERMNGIFTLIHFFIFFLMLGIFKDKKDWINLFKISVICSFFVSLSAIYQKINPLFLGPMRDPQIYGTLGNAIILSTYLIFNLFLALFLYFNDARGNKKWWLVVFFVNLMTILLAASLSVYLALFLGGIAFLYLNRKAFARRGKKKFSYLFGVSALLILFCLSVFFTAQGMIFQKLIKLFSPQGSLLERIEAWKMGIQAFGEKPFSGYGWENFNLIFDKFYNPKFFVSLAPGFDRAHNVLVDFLALSGILGLLAYIAIFIFAYFSLKNGLLNQKATKIDFGIFLALLISYSTVNFFNFDTFSSFLMFFLILGYLNWLSTNNESFTNMRIRKFELIRKFVDYIKLEKIRNSVIVCLIPIILFTLNFNLQSALANFYAYQGIKSTVVDEVIKNFQKSEKYQNFDQTSLRGEMADFLAKVSREGIPEDSLKIYEFLEPLLKQDLEKEPRNPNHYLRLGVFYRNWGKVDQTKLTLAENIFEKAIEQNPKKQSFYFLSAQTKTLMGEHKNAIRLAQAGVNLYDKSPQAHFYLSLAYLFGGDETNFKNEIQKFKNLNNELFGTQKIKNQKLSPKKIAPLRASATTEDYIEIFEIYWPTKNWQKIMVLADEISKSGDDPFLHEYLAGLYAALGEKEKAKKEAWWVIENYPELKAGSLRFLQTLGPE